MSNRGSVSLGTSVRPYRTSLRLSTEVKKRGNNPHLPPIIGQGLLPKSLIPCTSDMICVWTQEKPSNSHLKVLQVGHHRHILDGVQLVSATARFDELLFYSCTLGWSYIQNVWCCTLRMMIWFFHFAVLSIYTHVTLGKIRSCCCCSFGVAFPTDKLFFFFKQ